MIGKRKGPLFNLQGCKTEKEKKKKAKKTYYDTLYINVTQVVRQKDLENKIEGLRVLYIMRVHSFTLYKLIFNRIMAKNRTRKLQ